MSTEHGRQRITRELLFASFVGSQADSDDPLVRERIIASVIERDCNPGDILFARDDEATHVHFMTEGRVRMSRPGYADWVHEGWWVMGTNVDAEIASSRPSFRRWGRGLGEALSGQGTRPRAQARSQLARGAAEPPLASVRERRRVRETELQRGLGHRRRPALKQASGPLAARPFDELPEARLFDGTRSRGTLHESM